MMDIPLDEVLHFGAITSDSTGAAVDADVTPTWAVREEDTDAATQGGDFTKRTGLDGHYKASVTLSAANGFEAGKWYEILGLATVGSVAGKAILKTFRVVPAESSAGVPKVDPSHWRGQAIPATNQTGVPIVDVGYVDGTGVEPSGVLDVNVVTVEGTDATDYFAALFPSNFAALGISEAGHVLRVTVVDTTTENSDMRGTDGAALTGEAAAAAAGLALESTAQAIKARTDEMPIKGETLRHRNVVTNEQADVEVTDTP